jgi:hypothetical protein
MTAIIQAQARLEGLKPGPRCYITQSLCRLTALALFIIGCLGAAGVFPGSTMIGWVTVGLAGGMFVFTLASGNCGNRIPRFIFHLLTTVALVTVGALGGVGTLSMTQVGWGLIGISLAGSPLDICTGLSQFAQIKPNK